MALRDTDTTGFNDRLMRAPVLSRVGGHSAYMWLFAGGEWCYYYSSHATSKNVPCGVMPNGEVTLGVQDWKDNRSVRGFVPMFQTLGKRSAS